MFEAFGGVVVCEYFAVLVVDDVHGVRHVGPGEVINGFAFRMDAA